MFSFQWLKALRLEEGLLWVGVSTEPCRLGLGQNYSVLLGLSGAASLGLAIIAFGLGSQMRKHKLWKVKRIKGDSQKLRFWNQWVESYSSTILNFLPIHKKKNESEKNPHCDISGFLSLSLHLPCDIPCALIFHKLGTALITLLEEHCSQAESSGQP